MSNKYRHEGKIYNNQDRGNFQTFSISVSSKDKDGDWHNIFINCVYNGDMDLEDRAEYELKGFLGVNAPYKKYKESLKFVVSEASKIKNQSTTTKDMNKW